MQMRSSDLIGIDNYDEPVERVDYQFGLTRRGFVQILGAGLLIAVSDAPALAQRRGGRGGGMGGVRIRNVAARVHIGKDGSITVMTGKVEAGQGSRAELTQAAAEELRVAVDRIQLLMADTGVVPDDGITAGSGTTPRSVPAVRQGCAAARALLVQLAADRWHIEPGELQVRDGKVSKSGNGESFSYADLAGSEEGAKSFAQPMPSAVTVTPLSEWKVLGTSVARPDRGDLVTGRHRYPSDIIRPGMLHGKVLRAPSYGAMLKSIDLGPAKAIENVVAFQDGNFVGFAAPSSFAAEKAMEAASQTAVWETTPHPSSKTLFAYLREHARNLPKNPFTDEMTKAAKSLRQTYNVSYIQHTPMEPRAAVAEWDGERVTVWMSTQNPFGCQGEIARAFSLPPERVRVIVPDFGGGFGGKHSAEAGIEAARIAKAAGKPVALRWTRAEEFTWAYFRPAAVIDIEAALNSSSRLACWHHVNINAGGNAMETPYRVANGKSRSQSVQSAPPLRHGSYRALASTGNIFARESFMDEMADAAGVDPLEFRLAHLEEGRLRDVLKTVAEKFNWAERSKKKEPNTGVGLACGTEKGSFVAACVEVAVDAKGRIAVRHVTQAFECGTIMNPDGLLSQVQGAIIMGIGGATKEAMEFENGQITNASFYQYEVPRLSDVPTLDIHLMNRPDLPSAGAGETPIVAVAPAIANAVFRATGQRIRQMPIRLAAPGSARA
jgi:isoquinoline 1-oxidoreductase